jgi:hypothetical protein
MREANETGVRSSTATGSECYIHAQHRMKLCSFMHTGSSAYIIAYNSCFILNGTMLPGAASTYLPTLTTAQ